MKEQTKEQVMVKEHNRILLDNLIEQERKDAISEFKKKLKKKMIFQKRDVNGDGDIFVPIGVIIEEIEKTAQEIKWTPQTKKIIGNQ